MTYLGKRIAARADSTELYGMQDNDGLKLYNRSNWDVTGKPAVVLATTIWENSKDNDQVIKTAEIHFNTKQYAFVDNLQPDLPEDEAQEFVDLETLLLHEVGHALGLSHQLASVDVNSVMNPTVFIGRGLTNRTFSEMDIANIQLIYRR